jgi:hypothetical protein
MIRSQVPWLLLFGAMLFAACKQQQSSAPPQTNATPTLATASQTMPPEQRPLTEIDLTINGVRADTSEAKVLKGFGKPRRIKKGGWDDCVGGYDRDLYYDGLSIDLLSDEKGRNFAVVGLDLTSDKWTVDPGLRVGDPISKVRELYGEPNSDDKERLYYVSKNDDGWINFYYQGGKVTRISMQITLC